MNAVLAEYPEIDKAKLPQVYEQAKQALAECSRIDECKDWMDKSDVMVRYARQAKDDSMLKMARRIQARAYERCGELLKEIDSRFKQDRDKWIKQARLNFDPGDKQACAICGKYKSLTHAHHIIPLAIQYRRNYIHPDQSYVWMCPTHHAAIHMFLNIFESKLSEDVQDKRISELQGDLSHQEMNELIDLLFASKIDRSTMTDEQATEKIKEYGAMAKGSNQHADELERYLANRQAA